MIELYTAPTPNGHKVSIALEEMDLDYEVKLVILQKENKRERSFYPFVLMAEFQQ